MSTTNTIKQKTPDFLKIAYHYMRSHLAARENDRRGNYGDERQDFYR